jgi:hypothetical protein
MTKFERMEGLVFRINEEQLAEGVEGITLELLNDGFDEDDILEFLESKVRTAFENTLKLVKK